MNDIVVMKCGTCGRHVDSCAFTSNPASGLNTLTVTCHGRVDRIHFTDLESFKKGQPICFIPFRDANGQKISGTLVNV